ncbi:MAG: LytR C-terminal domain-containing protein [Pseudonocardiales bacterium]
MTRQLANRRRRERAVGIALATLGVGVLVIALIALRSPNGRGPVAKVAATTKATTSTSPASSKSTSKPATTTAQTTPASGKLPLVVLNNTQTAGLAGQAKDRFETGGWTVTGTGTLSNDIASTCAYYDPASPGAQAAARALQTQFPAIKRVMPKFAELPAGPIVVVLTSDYS